jgi:hypothetical protein
MESVRIAAATATTADELGHLCCIAKIRTMSFVTIVIHIYSY